MSAGLGLLRQLLHEKRGIQVLSENGITTEYFRSEEREIYEAIANHQRRFKTIPEQRTVEVDTGIRFGNLPEEPLGYWIEQVINRYECQKIIQVFDKVRDEAVGGSVDVAKGELRKLVFSLTDKGQRDKIHLLGQEAKSVMDEHNKRRIASRVSGVPFGLPFLDRISDGAQATDTVALVGRPGTGKTYLMLAFALFAYLNSQAVPLFVPMEMSPFQCSRRLLALKSGMSATQLRLGRLDSFNEEDAMLHVNELLDMEKPFYMLGASLHTTIEDLALRVQELRPSALYVDGAYLARTAKHFRSRWERIAEVSEVLKSIAYENEIPVIGSYQFNRKMQIGGSDAIEQLASIVMGLRPERGEDFFTGRDYKILQLMKGREGEVGSVRVLFNTIATRITQDSVLEGEGLFEGEEGRE